MATSSVKHSMSLLAGLFLIVALLAIGAAAQNRGKKARSSRAVATAPVENPPTSIYPYACRFTINGNVGYSTVVMSYYRPMPEGGVLGNIHTNLYSGGVIDKAMQVYNSRPPAAGMGEGTLWSFQHQDGSVVCKEMFVSTDKRIVRFSQCSNGAIQECRQ